jgi:hypothetical protein
LEDDLQLSSSQCATEQLIAIPISFIPMNLEVGKEALDRFIERYSVFGEFIVLKVVFKIRRSKPIPIDHDSLYRGGRAFRARCRPNDSAAQPRAARELPSDKPKRQRAARRPAAPC